MNDPVRRAEVVRRRLAFEADPIGFRDRWAEAEREEGRKIVEAQRLLPSVVVPAEVLEALCARCAREGAEGLRADLTIYKAASALAAYERRSIVTHEDVEAVAELALSHRRTTPPHRGPSPPPPDPPGNPPPSPSRPDEGSTDSSEKSGPESRSPSLQDRGTSPTGGQSADSQVIASADPSSLSCLVPVRRKRRSIGTSGRRGNLASTDRQGVAIRSEAPGGRATDLALDATLRAAAPWQTSRGRISGGRLIWKVADLRVKVRARPMRHLILFVVDASRSMGARKRMAQTKAAVLSLVVDAYQKRDCVGLITFGGVDAQLVLAPTRSVRVAARKLADLPIGGATPLAQGLTLASQVVKRSTRREPGLIPLVVLVTDGRGNVPLEAKSDPTADSLELTDRLARSGVMGLVIDTESGPVRLGLAARLAQAWDADYLRLDELGGRPLSEAVRLALFRRPA
jgi:magnesium chelatase subunit D